MENLVKYELNYSLIASALDVKNLNESELGFAIKHCKLVIAASDKQSTKKEKKEAKIMLKPLLEMLEINALIDAMKITIDKEDRAECDFKSFAKELSLRNLKVSQAKAIELYHFAFLEADRELSHE